MPWCLSDPKLFQYSGKAFRARLDDGIRHRQRLEGWASDPSSDFDGEVRKAYPENLAAKVVRSSHWAHHPLQEFTLDELLTGEPPLHRDVTLAFGELPVSIPEAAAWKLLNHGETLAAQIPGPGCTLASA